MSTLKLPHRVITRIPVMKFGITPHLRPLYSWLEQNIGKPYEEWCTLGDDDIEKTVVFCRTEKQAVLIALRWS